jgi:hypothetical protein
MRGDQQMNSFFDQMNVINWDEQGLEVKFDFVQPLNISVGQNPDYVVGKIQKEYFAFFISDSDWDKVLEEEISMSIEIPA